jgi:hypothetical protein
VITASSQRSLGLSKADFSRRLKEGGPLAKPPRSGVCVADAVISSSHNSLHRGSQERGDSPSGSPTPQSSSGASVIPFCSRNPIISRIEPIAMKMSSPKNRPTLSVAAA